MNFQDRVVEIKVDKRECRDFNIKYLEQGSTSVSNTSMKNYKANGSDESMMIWIVKVATEIQTPRASIAVVGETLVIAARGRE